jgi:hypothetical protein
MNHTDQSAIDKLIGVLREPVSIKSDAASRLLQARPPTVTSRLCHKTAQPLFFEFLHTVVEELLTTAGQTTG